MANKEGIRYIKHQQIDTEKWDACVGRAENSRIYAYTWHLDRTAVTWDALIYGDYTYIMPLPVKRKWGIRYVYQPIFSQQLGIFPFPPEEVLKVFYAKLTKLFRFVETHLNSGHSSQDHSFSIQLNRRKNFLLPLDPEYDSLKRRFSSHAKRNIGKAKKADPYLLTGIRLEDYLKFKSDNLPSQVPQKSMEALKSLIAFGQYKGFGEIWGVYSHDNQLRAAVYFCRNKDRIIYMNAVSSPEGKKERSMYFLLDGFIQRHAGQLLTLDFEGSMIPGVARFFEGFGAYSERYFLLRINRLPLLLKKLKK